MPASALALALLALVQGTRIFTIELGSRHTRHIDGGSIPDQVKSYACTSLDGPSCYLMSGRPWNTDRKRSVGKRSFGANLLSDMFGSALEVVAAALLREEKQQSLRNEGRGEMLKLGIKKPQKQHESSDSVSERQAALGDAAHRTLQDNPKLEGASIQAFLVHSDGETEELSKSALGELLRETAGVDQDDELPLDATSEFGDLDADKLGQIAKSILEAHQAASRVLHDNDDEEESDHTESESASSFVSVPTERPRAVESHHIDDND